MNKRTQFSLIHAEEFNYFRAMKENGYHIQYYGKNDAFDKDAFPLSVTEWHNHLAGMPGGKPFYTYPEAGWYSMLKAGSDIDYNDTGRNGDLQAVAQAVEWLKNDPPQPFVLFMATLGAHPPYGSPKYFNDMWTVEDVLGTGTMRPPNTSNKPKYHSSTRGIPFHRNLTTLGPRQLARIQATYLGMISCVDWMFGTLLKAIEEAGLDDNTAIIYSSDHGDFAGDYGMVEKWPGGADDILTRVPLYIKVPGMTNKAKGYVAKGAVSLMDVTHTMALLGGVNVSDVPRFGVNFGTSLVKQVLHGQEEDEPRYVYSEGGFSNPDEVFPMGSDHVPNNPQHLYYPRAMEEMSDNGNGSPRWIMIRNATNKLVFRYKDTSELYDLEADPQELNNLYGQPEHALMQRTLAHALTGWLMETSDIMPLTQDSRSAPPFPSTASVCAQQTMIENKLGQMLMRELPDVPTASQSLMMRGTYEDLA